MLTCSVFLPELVYQIALVGQLAGYIVALVGLLPAVGTRFRLAAVAGSFLVLNAAAGLALVTWLSGRAGRSWHRVSYCSGKG